jgi:phosphoglycerate kinase
MKTIDDFAVAGQRVLVRDDLNVPLDGGRVADDGRIRAALPTLAALLDRQAKVIICAHLGRPAGQPDPEYSLAPAAALLGELLGRPVTLAADVIGPSAQAAVSAMSPGGLVMLENLRFDAWETSKDDTRLGLFADELAALADLYVSDGFGVLHRKQASVYDIAMRLPHAAGYLVRAEAGALRRLTADIQRPYVVVLGGAKVEDKVDAIGDLISVADRILIGGAVAFPFLAAQGHKVGTSLLNPDQVGLARGYLDLAARAGTKIILPSDVVVAAERDADAPHEVVAADAIPADRMGLDIGPESARLFAASIHGAGTVFWNGPMGVFELAPVRQRHPGPRLGADQRRGIHRGRRRRHRRGHPCSRLPGRRVRLHLHRRWRQPGVHPGQDAARPGRSGQAMSTHGFPYRLVVLRHGQSEWNAAAVFPCAPPRARKRRLAPSRWPRSARRTGADAGASRRGPPRGQR